MCKWGNESIDYLIECFVLEKMFSFFRSFIDPQVDHKILLPAALKDFLVFASSMKFIIPFDIMKFHSVGVNLHLKDFPGNSSRNKKIFPSLNVITQKEIGVFRSQRLIDGKRRESRKYAE